MVKVLIAEDEFLIAELMVDTLTGHGYDVVGVARTVSEALGLAIQYRPDVAILDLHLADGDLGTDIADSLKNVKIGILYATGQPEKLVGAIGHAFLRKPYRYGDLVRSLEVICDMVASGKPNPPYPKSLRFLAPAILRS